PLRGRHALHTHFLQYRKRHRPYGSDGQPASKPFHWTRGQGVIQVVTNEFKPGAWEIGVGGSRCFILLFVALALPCGLCSLEFFATGRCVVAFCCCPLPVASPWSD
ncbi:MAG: hypothetical protein Q9228_005006, partial [Teloschistes exilis]